MKYTEIKLYPMDRIFVVSQMPEGEIAYQVAHRREDGSTNVVGGCAEWSDNSLEGFTCSAENADADLMEEMILHAAEQIEAKAVVLWEEANRASAAFDAVCFRLGL